MWRCALETSGTPSVTQALTTEMQVWVAGNLASPDSVSELHLGSNYIYWLAAPVTHAAIVHILLADAVAIPSAMYGSSPSAIRYDNVMCNGTEETVSECGYSTTPSARCSFTTLAGLMCRAERMLCT